MTSILIDEVAGTVNVNLLLKMSHWNITITLVYFPRLAFQSSLWTLEFAGFIHCVLIMIRFSKCSTGHVPTLMGWKGDLILLRVLVSYGLDPTKWACCKSAEFFSFSFSNSFPCWWTSVMALSRLPVLSPWLDIPLASINHVKSSKAPLTY